MKKTLLLNKSLIFEHIGHKHYEDLANYIKSCFLLERNNDGNLIEFEFSKEAVDSLVDLLEEDSSLVKQEVFRALRNYIVNPEVAEYLSKDGSIFSIIENILRSENEESSLRLTLQFLINFQIHKKGSIIFQNLVPTVIEILKRILCVYEVSALLYNISLNCCISKFLKLDDYILIINMFASEPNEFLQFLCETIMTEEEFWMIYESLCINHRIIILQLIKEKRIAASNFTLPEIAIEKLSEYFTSSCERIFKTVNSNDTSDLSAYEISLLLEVLSFLSADDIILSYLCKKKDFLINAGALLINIHELSKTSDNCFSKIQRLNEIREPTLDIQQHPAFGFKADLIRIIGNLCWKNRTMQDLVRTAELIPVILDCSNMDARNPFIMQWAILAIRNLCEDNRENQAVIAGMHQQGTVSSNVLEEMGLTLQSDGENSIKIVPLDSIRK